MGAAILPSLSGLWNSPSGTPTPSQEGMLQRVVAALLTNAVGQGVVGPRKPWVRRWVPGPGGEGEGDRGGKGERGKVGWGQKVGGGQERGTRGWPPGVAGERVMKPGA